MSILKLVFVNGAELIIDDSTALIGLQKNENTKDSDWIESVQFVGIKTGPRDKPISKTRELAEFFLNCEFFYVSDNVFVQQDDLLEDDLYSVSSVHKVISLN